jgi:hypothetical protein
MNVIEKRARELLADEYAKGQFRAYAPEIRSGAGTAFDEEIRAIVAIIAALTPPEGHVVVTRNEAGQAIAVTRQDDEGRILSVIAEFEPPEGYVLVPVEMTEAMQRAGAGIVCTDVEEIRQTWAAMLAARPEVP